MRKSRFDNPKFMERRRRVLERNPHLALCYPWCTPEDEAEFYAAIDRGTARYGLTFTRPRQPAAPAAPAPSATGAAAGRATPRFKAPNRPVNRSR